MPDKNIVVMPPLGPASIRWAIVRADRIWGEINSMAFQSEYRPNSRWEADFTFPQRKGERTQSLEALLVRASRGDHAIMVPDHKSMFRGTFDPNEMIMNPQFINNAGWTNGAQAKLTISDFEARLQTLVSNASTATLRTTYSLPVIAGHHYVFRVAWRRGSSAAANDVHVQAILEGASSNLLAGSAGGGMSGVITRLYSPQSNTTVVPVVKAFDSTVFRNVYIDWVSFTRCAVFSAAVSPTRIQLQGLTPNLDRAFVRGQMLEFCTSFNDTQHSRNQGWAKSELKKVVGHVDTTAGGTAWLEIEPPLRNIPPTTAPVIVHQPSAKMIFADPSLSVDRRESGFTGVGIRLLEDLNAIS